MGPRHRSFPTALALAFSAVALLGVGGGTAQAAAAGEQAPVANLKVNLSAQRFVVHGDRLMAEGPAFATATTSSGVTTAVRKKVRMSVNTTGTCRILELHLARLYLNLLGLKARATSINVEITGDREQILGDLFCSLSEGIDLNKKTLARRSAAALNRRLQGHPLPIMGFETPLRPHPALASGSASGPSAQVSQVALPAGECEVLNLILGPLHLDLLGLVVDLYGATTSEPVQVLVSGDPSAGLLGNVLCSLTTA